MLDQADVERRLDLAAEYFETDSKACEKELLSLLAEPELPLDNRFAAQVQLAYNAKNWQKGESYRKEAEKVFAALKEENKGDGRDGLKLQRFLLDELREWQDQDRPSGGVGAKKHVRRPSRKVIPRLLATLARSVTNQSSGLKTGTLDGTIHAWISRDFFFLKLLRRAQNLSNQRGSPMAC